jgi:hypothetical protein
VEKLPGQNYPIACELPELVRSRYVKSQQPTEGR